MSDIIGPCTSALLCTLQVRRALKEEGWDALTVEEKRFTMLDRVLRPDLYQWMKASEQQMLVSVDAFRDDKGRCETA